MMECNGNGMSKPNEHDHLKISLPYSLWDTTNPTAVLWMPTVIFQLARELNYMGRCFADSTSPRCWNGALGGTAGIWQALRISCTFQTHSASKGKTLLISTAQNKQAHHKVGGDGGRRNSATHWTECTIEKEPCKYLFHVTSQMHQPGTCPVYTTTTAARYTKGIISGPGTADKKRASSTPTAGWFAAHVLRLSSWDCITRYPL